MQLIDKIDSFSSYKDRAAYIYREETLYYRDLKEKSDALANYIISSFENDKIPIIVFGHKQSMMLICFIACVKSGHPYIPVDSSMSQERIKDILENSKSKLILSITDINDADFSDKVIINVQDIKNIINKFIGQKLDRRFMVCGDEIFYIIYTSGSTGKPKGVAVTALNLESFVKWGLSISRLEDKNIFMNQAPFSFDLSVMGTYIPLASGSTIYSIDKDMIKNLKELFYYLKISGVTNWVSTPSFMELCLASEKFDRGLIPNLRQALFCGESLPKDCVRTLKERFKDITVTNSYGPTEATVAVTSIDITDEMLEKQDDLPVGNVKKDCSIIIENENRSILEECKKGEIVVAGSSVSKGYYRNEKMTDKNFFEIHENGVLRRGYRTGDRGYLKNGILYYCGRMDFQIKLNGFRIELEDIENNLRKLEFVKNAAAVPVYKDNKIFYIAAFVVLNERTCDKSFKQVLKIKKELKNYIPEYMIPRKILIKDFLPMNANGKIDRKLLMEEI